MEVGWNGASGHGEIGSMTNLHSTQDLPTKICFSALVLPTSRGTYSSRGNAWYRYTEIQLTKLFQQEFAKFLSSFLPLRDKGWNGIRDNDLTRSLSWIFELWKRKNNAKKTQRYKKRTGLDLTKGQSHRSHRNVIYLYTCLSILVRVIIHTYALSGDDWSWNRRRPRLYYLLTGSCPLSTRKSHWLSAGVTRILSSSNSRWPLEGRRWPSSFAMLLPSLPFDSIFSNRLTARDRDNPRDRDSLRAKVNRVIYHFETGNVRVVHLGQIYFYHNSSSSLPLLNNCSRNCSRAHLFIGIAYFSLKKSKHENQTRG